MTTLLSSSCNSFRVSWLMSCILVWKHYCYYSIHLPTVLILPNTLPSWIIFSKTSSSKYSFTLASWFLLRSDYCHPKSVSYFFSRKISSFILATRSYLALLCSHSLLHSASHFQPLVMDQSILLASGAALTSFSLYFRLYQAIQPLRRFFCLLFQNKNE